MSNLIAIVMLGVLLGLISIMAVRAECRSLEPGPGSWCEYVLRKPILTNPRWAK